MTARFDTYVDCDLCGQDDAVQVAEKDGTFYVKCRNCGFVYTNPRESDSDRAEGDAALYAESSEKYSGKFSEKKQAVYRKVLKPFARYRKSNRILEIGSNVGAFLNQAREQGWDPEGIEPVEHCAKIAMEQHGLKTHACFLEDAGLPDDHFDVVYSNAVYEHLPSPMTVSREIARILRPGGVVYTNTVNYESYTRERLENDWKLLAPIGHLSLFSPVTLAAFHEKAGLEVIKVRSNGVRNRADERGLLKPLRKGWFSTLSRYTLKGDRIIVLARKP